MNNTTHTPGPWILSQSGTIDAVNYGWGGLQIAKITGIDYKTLRTCNYHEQVNAANGRVMAAAPALLAACKMALEEGDDFKAMQALREAIAQAEGK